MTLAAENNYKVNVVDPETDYDEYFQNYYTKPYCRFIPYLMGVLAGFVYLRYSRTYVEKIEDTHTDTVCSLIIRCIRETKFGAIISFLTGFGIIIFLIIIQRQVYADIFDSNI